MTRRGFLRHLGALGLGLLAPGLIPTLDACASAGRSTRATSSSAAAALGGGVRARGRRLVTASGQEVRLTGVNWFGLETSLFAPHGLWARNWRDMLRQIASLGFNTLRLPFSNQLFESNSVPTSIDFTKNPDLKGLSGLEIMDRVIGGAADVGLAVVLDRHRPRADAQSELWYTNEVPESRWIEDWVMLAHRYGSQAAVIGADLHNEPHGRATWGDGNLGTDWRLAAERAGNAILAAKREWLIFVEGIERFAGSSYWWGGNLQGARSAPVRLSDPGKLVYSAHDYGPGVGYQPWFQAAGFPGNLPDVWHTNWQYLVAEDISPVLLGELGGRSVGQDPEGEWQRALVQYLKDNGVSYTYWSWNPDSGDTGGVLEDDWLTVNEAKLQLLETYRWPRLVAAGS